MYRLARHLLYSCVHESLNKERKQGGRNMKSKLFALVLLAGASAFAGPRVFVGVGVGYAAPVVSYGPPPAPIVAYAPPAPGPGYSWVAGYYAPVGPQAGHGVQATQGAPAICARLLGSAALLRRPVIRRPLAPVDQIDATGGIRPQTRRVIELPDSGAPHCGLPRLMPQTDALEQLVRYCT